MLKKNGREVLSAKKWREQRRPQVFASSQAETGIALCMGCGNPIELETFECHHEGGRGLGGGKRDDREFIPGTEDQWDKYPFMPETPEGFRRNLFALCYYCHKGEHNQGCSGQLQWSKNARRESDETDLRTPTTEDSGAVVAEAFDLADRAATRRQHQNSETHSEGD